MSDGPGAGTELLLDRFVPHFDLNIVHAGVYRVPPPACYEAVLALDVFESPVIRGIIGARGVPARLAELRPGRRPARSAGNPTYRFRDFAEPGFAKIAASFRVDPYGSGSTILTTETRVVLTDPESRRQSSGTGGSWDRSAT